MAQNKITIAQIVPHETPDAASVRRMRRALRSGQKLPPIEITAEMYQHWKMGPKGMEPSGFGYGLIDGHHRLEAMRCEYGDEYVLAQGEYQKYRPPTPAPDTPSPNHHVHAQQRHQPQRNKPG